MAWATDGAIAAGDLAVAERGGKPDGESLGPGLEFLRDPERGHRWRCGVLIDHDCIVSRGTIVALPS